MPSKSPRLAPEWALPTAAYVPGRGSRPLRSEGNLTWRGRFDAIPLSGDEPGWRYVLDLMSFGYYWEAHEALEHWWRHSDHVDPRRALFQGLLRLAAAGVKVRESRAAGVVKHARRAAELLRGVGSAEAQLLGLAIDDTIAAAESVADRAIELAVQGTGLGLAWSRRPLTGLSSKPGAVPKYRIDGDSARP